MKVEYYNQNKELTDTEILDPAEGKYGLHVPAGQWHTVIPLESGTMVFEVKDGPYMPFQPEDVLVADRVSGSTNLTRLASKQLIEWLEEYSLGQLWEKNELGGRPTRESSR